MAPGTKRGRKAAEPVEASEDASAAEDTKRQKASGKKGGKAKADPPAYTSEQPVIVFAHGAGANSKHEWMVRWKKLLATTTNAVEVITFDYPYLQGEKRKAPPKAEKLVDDHIGQIVKAQKKHPGHPVVLVGKSMGSRVGCMVAGQKGADVEAVVCLGYPLKGVSGQLRDQTLLDLQAPVMFVQGTKDSMCPLDTLEQVRKKLSVHHELFVVDGGDHSLKVGAAALKKSGSTQVKLDQSAADAIHKFLTETLSSGT